MPMKANRLRIMDNVIFFMLRYYLMMNHDSIEVSDKIFGFATPAQKEFNAIFREKAFEIAIKYNTDMIFTYVCAFEMQEERDYLNNLHNLFTQNGGSFYFVELSADLDTRLARNETPHRMEKKVSKRDLAWSKENLLSDAKVHRLNTEEDEFLFDKHLKIDNRNITPEQVADMVIEAFKLIPNNKDEKEYRYGV